MSTHTLISSGASGDGMSKAQFFDTSGIVMLLAAVKQFHTLQVHGCDLTLKMLCGPRVVVPLIGL